MQTFVIASLDCGLHPRAGAGLGTRETTCADNPLPTSSRGRHDRRAHRYHVRAQLFGFAASGADAHSAVGGEQIAWLVGIPGWSRPGHRGLRFEIAELVQFSLASDRSALANDSRSFRDHELAMAKQRARHTISTLALAAVATVGWTSVVQAQRQAVTRVAPITAFASTSDADTPASAAVDGKLGTWWAGAGLGTSLTLDLGSAKQVKQVRIAFHAGDERAYNFEIQASNDGQSYTSAGWFQSTGTTRNFESFEVTAPGRYLRIVGSGNSVDRANAYREVQVFATSSLVQLAPVGVLASPTDPNAPAARAIDGNLNTEWAGAGVGTQLTFDFGVPKAIQQVRIAFYNGNARTYGFQVQTSLDGQTYTSAGSFQSSGTTSLFESFSINAVGRYLRIVGWGNNINRNNSYYEVQAFGSAAPQR